MAAPADRDQTAPAPTVPPGDESSARRRHRISVLKHTLGPILAALASIVIAHIQHSAGKAETDKSVAVAYGTLAPAAQEHTTEIEDLKKAVAQLADTVQLQGKLLLATRPGFGPDGNPETVPAARGKRRKHGSLPPADPALVKKVQINATKNLEELKESAREPPPSVVQVPDALPREIPAPAAPQK